ncbi:tetraacyldisaccharide 4'-kinase [uncultured Kriegella sp.]|uniref:tetraacyldisaccharide 4'-kinase n=1 Tax=uncultured Kriegella sp. TaxID=1798910 RepID=UPI0030DB82E5
MQLLRKIAFPISLIYALVVYVRNYFYDVGIFSSKTFNTPTICIGNLSVGGTGKTPMVELLISALKDSYKIAVLSRGYRRKSRGFGLAVPESTVEALGDEPYQIYSKFPEITVAVDADRRHGISVLEDKIGPDLILLDDAFQHRKVKPDFSILLTAYDDIYIEDWYLPTGNLRDSKKAAKRADVIVVTKCPPALSIDERQTIKEKLRPTEGQSVLFSYLVYDNIVKGHMENLSLDELNNQKITLVTGIADPRPLISFLETEKITFEHLAYADHHFFTQKELLTLNSKEVVLTTEKDFVRLKNHVKNLFYIQVAHMFFDNGQSTLQTLLGSLKKKDY